MLAIRTQSSFIAAVVLGLAFVPALSQSEQSPGLIFGPDRAVKSELQKLCDVESKTDTAEAETLRIYTSPVLESALHSGTELLSFITDPSTPYLDRMAAAERGGALIGPADLSKLWSSLEELATLPESIADSPCTYLQSANKGTSDWPLRHAFDPRMPKVPSRTVLGSIQFDREKTDYPITADDRARSPWIWQVGRALNILNDEVSLYYRDPARYPLRVNAAWNWHPAQANGSILRTNELIDSAPRDILWLQTVITLAMEHPDEACVAASRLGSQLNDDYHMEELIQTAQIIILQKSNECAAGQASYWVSRMALDKPDADFPQHKPLKSATAMLAMSHWALDPSVGIWERYYGFAKPLCEMATDCPMQTNLAMSPGDESLPEAMMVFERWFARERSQLEQETTQERPHLQVLARGLSQTIK